MRIDPGNTAFTPLAFDRYPFTHSMVAAVAWGAIFGGVYGWRTGRSRAAVWLGLTVFSHWVLDWVTHRADLQLAPGMPFRTGLGLWNSVPGTFAVEIALWIAGIWIYVRTTRPRDRAGDHSGSTFGEQLSVDVATMTDLDDHNDKNQVPNLVQNSVVPLSKAVSVLPREFFATRRPRVARQRRNLRDDSLALLLREGFDLLAG